jgi:hypothetical protein
VIDDTEASRGFRERLIFGLTGRHGTSDLLVRGPRRNAKATRPDGTLHARHLPRWLDRDRRRP